MQFLEAEVFRIAEDVFRIVLGLDVVAAEGPPAAPDRRTYLGSVQISGAWEGVVQLHAPEALVARAAGVMFGASGELTSLEQRQDAFGELSNIVAGNTKALLPGPCSLSLPTVVVGTDYQVRVPSRTRLRTAIALACAGDILVVRLFEGPAGDA